jgi:outer membrane protein OmpU
VIVGLDATFGNTDVKVFAGEASDLDYTQYGIGVTHSMDALTVHGFVRNDSTAARTPPPTPSARPTRWAAARPSRAASPTTTLPGSDAVADLGIKFSF